jgi:diguanylate cyclase (GGDEF)-like protein
VTAAVADPERLAALRATRLLDSAAERAFDRMTRLAASVLSAPTAVVSLVTDDRQFLKSSFGLGEPLRSVRGTPISHSICKYVVSGRRPLVVEDTRQHPSLRDHLAVSEYDIIAYAGVPLETSDGEILGALCVVDSRPRRWSAETINLLEELAAATVAEVELRHAHRLVSESQVKLEQALAQLSSMHAAAELQSRRDHATGLLNRRGFVAAAEDALARAGSRTVMVYADLDGLKEINDTFGHEVGDAAIVAAADVLRWSFRSTDLLARLGGDELCVLLADTDATCAAALVARVEDEVRRFNEGSGHRWALSLSVGFVATDENDRPSIDAMLVEADAKMYAIKRARRRTRA